MHACLAAEWLDACLLGGVAVLLLIAAGTDWYIFAGDRGPPACVGEQ
jgi:hypothetical protein